MLRLRVVALLTGLVVLAAAAPADAALSRKKSIWGPVLYPGNQSAFPIYQDLGAGIYQTKLEWRNVATARPQNPRSPDDPAYHWIVSIDNAIGQAKRYGLQVALMIKGTPSWANGGRDQAYAPKNPRDYADFLEAVARRYPTVHLWMIWGEPTRHANWMPITKTRNDRPLTRTEGGPARRYARLLDASYGRLKRLSRRNLVIGGNSFVTGDIGPLNWIRNLKLPNGRPPRMDLYGHNPFSAREPKLSRPLIDPGQADFSDLDMLAGWIDRYLGRRPGKGRKQIKLFLSEYMLPTDHKNRDFGFWLDRDAQARFLTSAMRIARSWSRIYTLGYFTLLDDPPAPDGLEVNRGLIDYQGNRKPGYFAFKAG